MKYRKILAILLTVMLSTVLLTLGVIYLHDNPANVTLISSINSEMTHVGANVTVKGNITSISTTLMGSHDQFVWLSDKTGSLNFFWTETWLSIGWIVIVKGTVKNNHSLLPASSVELVLLFP